MGKIDETIINIGFKKDNSIDNDNKVVFKIKRAYICIFSI